MIKDKYRVITLTQGYVAIIDAEDFRRVNKLKWHTHRSKGSKREPGKPYARANVGGKKVYLHRFVMNPAEGMEVDHRNHQTLDCRKENLRELTYEENQAHRRDRIKLRKSLPSSDSLESGKHLQKGAAHAAEADIDESGFSMAGSPQSPAFHGNNQDTPRSASRSGR